MTQIFQTIPTRGGISTLEGSVILVYNATSYPFRGTIRYSRGIQLTVDVTSPYPDHYLYGFRIKRLRDSVI